MLRRALRSSCLTRQPFRDVPTEFENRFLCLLRLSLCTVKRVDFQAVLCYTEGRKKQFVRLLAGFTIWRKSMRFSLLTTALTIYGFGLPGFYAVKSTRKQSIRTKKPRKARKITQKIRFLAFGTSMPSVRIRPLRPKISRKWGFSPHFRLIFIIANFFQKPLDSPPNGNDKLDLQGRNSAVSDIAKSEERKKLCIRSVNYQSCATCRSKLYDITTPRDCLCRTESTSLQDIGTIPLQS